MTQAEKAGKLTRTTIKFSVDYKPHKFDVYHNLPKTFGLNVECSFDNWVGRTKTYTAASFCKYVMSKDDSFVCMTKAQFQRISKLGI